MCKSILGQGSIDFITASNLRQTEIDTALTLIKSYTLVRYCLDAAHLLDLPMQRNGN